MTSAGNAPFPMMMLHVWCCVHPVNVPRVVSVGMFPTVIANGIDGDFSVGFRMLFHCFAAHSACLQIFGEHDSTHAIDFGAATAAAQANVYGSMVVGGLK